MIRIFIPIFCPHWNITNAPSTPANGKSFPHTWHNKWTTMWGWFFAFIWAPICTSCLFSRAQLRLSWLRLPLESRLSRWHTWRFEPCRLYAQPRDASDGDVTSKLLMSVTHIQMRIMKPRHECRHHGRATTSAPPLVLFSAYLSLEIQRSSTSARHIKDGCPSGRGMITQRCSSMTFPASSVILIPFPAE